MSTMAIPIHKTWLAASRPFSYTASTIPVALGGVMAWQQAPIHILGFVLAILGGMLIQFGTNMTNTYYDFENGVDTVESAGAANPVLVLGWLKPRTILTAALLSFAVTTIIGVYLILTTGAPILILGIVGISGGYLYTATPLAYKYQSLGVPMVFLLMGPLMAAGGWVVQTGQWALTPFLASIPVGFLVAAILHGNDLRDIETDRLSGIKTLSGRLGAHKAERFYYFLIWGSYVSLVVLVSALILSPWTLLAFATLPLARRLSRLVQNAFRGDANRLEAVEPLTAQLHMNFGLLLVAGQVLSLVS